MNLAICGVLSAGHQHVVRQVTPAAQSLDPGLLGEHTCCGKVWPLLSVSEVNLSVFCGKAFRACPLHYEPRS